MSNDSAEGLTMFTTTKSVLATVEGSGGAGLGQAALNAGIGTRNGTSVTSGMLETTILASVLASPARSRAYCCAKTPAAVGAAPKVKDCSASLLPIETKIIVGFKAAAQATSLTTRPARNGNGPHAPIPVPRIESLSASMGF